jgi:hypothetical protein
MAKRATNVETFISQELHSLLFLEEFVFARNKFTPPASSELELADAVVLLGDVLLIFQIKERLLDRRASVSAERKWFEKKVLGQATKQVRDTLNYLKAYSEILVPNERGHKFNLAASSYADIIKIIIHAPSPNLPNDCRCVGHHVSASAGFIHVLNASDYLELSRTLRVPAEVIQYFKFRERVLTQFPDACSGLPEAALAGHFIGSRPEVPPALGSTDYLRRLVDDSKEWDLAPLLRGLHVHLSASPDSTEYYAILLKFMKLPRSAWRTVKERVKLCYEKVQKDEFARPSRMVVTETGCGFVFVPIESEFVRSPDWQTIRVRAIENMTRLHKYDRRLSKCVGYLIGKDGHYSDTNWCLLSYEWTEEPELQTILDERSPFCPVMEGEAYGYYVVNEGAGESRT